MIAKVLSEFNWDGSKINANTTELLIIIIYSREKVKTGSHVYSSYNRFIIQLQNRIRYVHIDNQDNYSIAC